MVFHVSLRFFLHLHNMGPQPWFPSPEGAIQRAPQPWSPHHKASPPMLFLYVELIHSAPVKYENSIHYVFTLWVMRFLCFLNMVSLSWFSCSQPYVRATLFFILFFFFSAAQRLFPKILPRGAFFSGQQIKAWYAQLKRSFCLIALSWFNAHLYCHNTFWIAAQRTFFFEKNICRAALFFGKQIRAWYAQLIFKNAPI